MKARRLRLPPTPSPAVEDLRAHLRAIYATPMPWHSEQVANALTKPVLAQKGSTPKPPTIRLTLDPTRTAANIRAKMGAEYCQKLIKALS